MYSSEYKVFQKSHFGFVACFTKNKLSSCFGFLSALLQLLKKKRGILILLYDEYLL